MRLCYVDCEVWPCDINSHITIPAIHTSYTRGHLSRCEIEVVCEQTLHAVMRTTSITLLSSTQSVDSLSDRPAVVVAVWEVEAVCVCMQRTERGVSASDRGHTPCCHFITACRQTHYKQHLLPSRTRRVGKCMCVQLGALHRSQVCSP